MLDKILYVKSNSDMPLLLLQYVLSPFIYVGTIIDSFHSSGNSSLLQIEINVYESHSKLSNACFNKFCWDLSIPGGL